MERRRKWGKFFPIIQVLSFSSLFSFLPLSISLSPFLFLFLFPPFSFSFSLSLSLSLSLEKWNRLAHKCRAKGATAMAKEPRTRCTPSPLWRPRKNLVRLCAHEFCETEEGRRSGGRQKKWRKEEEGEEQK